VFAVGRREVPGQTKTGMVSHWMISCAVEPQVILVDEEWRATLLGGEKGWRGESADHEEWQDERQRWRERQAGETLWALGCLSEQCQCQWKTPLRLALASVDLTTRVSSVRFARLALFGTHSQTPPSVDNSTRKPSLEHILVADNIIPCEYLSVVYTVRLSGP
jgi:hypothetical protein